jgi:hypothetical protein
VAAPLFEIQLVRLHRDPGDSVKCLVINPPHPFPVLERTITRDSNNRDIKFYDSLFLSFYRNGNVKYMNTSTIPFDFHGKKKHLYDSIENGVCVCVCVVPDFLPTRNKNKVVNFSNK